MSSLQIVNDVINPVDIGILTDSPYDKIASNELTSRLNKINYKGHVEQLEYKGLYVHCLKKILDKTRISPITHMLLAMVLEKFNNTKNKIITIYLEEYMLKRDLKDTQFAKKQIKDNLALLRAFTIEYQSKKEIRGKEIICSIKGEGIIRNYEIKRNGTYIITLENNFYKILKNTPKFIYLPKIAYKIDPYREPYNWNLITKIMEHKAMNAKKKNPDCISVKTLVDACPHIKLDTDHKKRNIIEPFERGLDYFKDLFHWYYKKRDNVQPVTSRDRTDYYRWMEMYIVFEWKDRKHDYLAV